MTAGLSCLTRSKIVIPCPVRMGGGEVISHKS
jgi:hypothetical protein